MLERFIERNVCEYAKGKGFLHYKFVSPSNRGVPDRIVVSPHGQIFFIEFKNEKAKLTKLQKHVIDNLTRCFCNVYVIRTVADGMNLIDIYA
jgi:hypothetical protein